jgi:hypothetical protein
MTRSLYGTLISVEPNGEPPYEQPPDQTPSAVGLNKSLYASVGGLGRKL